MFDFELQFLRWLEGLRTDFLNMVFEGITLLGEETLIIFIVVALWLAVDKKLAQQVFFVTVASLSVNGIIKNFAQVPRPFTKGITCVRLDTATGYAFPSGHTQGFATWSSFFAIKLKQPRLSILVRVLIAAVAISRLYLGAHYPSDVLVGAGLGVGIAALGNCLFEKVKDVKKLYLGTLLALTPFIVYFLWVADPLFADLFKTFGMLGGLVAVSYLDETTAPLSYDVVWWKKLIRIVLGVGLALVLKEAIKLLNVFDVMQISLCIDAIRYFIVVITVGYLCPLLFKKINL
ncbi:MAG: phosphatase PAP2 family protein [Peptococcaceae bacterium]|nr:phosphatase PAP2 family protein [Peptococcaceae bacterium]